MKEEWTIWQRPFLWKWGAPIEFSKASQATSGTSAIKEFTRQLKKFEFEEPLEGSDDQLLYEPKGVCALITPWNWPISQVALKVIPAIAAGCTMVLKPSELAPLDSMIFAEMLDEAGCPAGVFNLVNGDGVGVGSQLYFPSRHRHDLFHWLNQSWISHLS